MKFASRIILVSAAMTLPNLLLVAIAVVKQQFDLAFLLLPVLIFGVLANVLIVYQLNSRVGEQIETVSQIKRFNYDSFSHILSYVPSLIAFSIDLSTGAFALATFYLFYLVILAASDIVVLNPVLHLFGWRFQPATLQMELGVEEVIVIVPPKDRLILGDQKLSELSGYGMYLLCENG